MKIYSSNRIRNIIFCVGWVSFLFILAVFVRSLTIVNASASITRRMLWAGYEGSPDVYVANEESVADLSNLVWGKVYNIFDSPKRLEILRIDSVHEQCFVLDKTLNALRYFGTYGYVMEFFKSHGDGFGSGTNQYNAPQGLAMQSWLGGSHWMALYVLDTGNKRIQKLQFNRVTRQVEHVDYIYTEEEYRVNPILS